MPSGEEASEASPDEDPRRGPTRSSTTIPGTLAEAAGYADRELWWEHQIDHRRDARGLFEGILDAMTALRAGREPSAGGKRAAKPSCAGNRRGARRHTFVTSSRYVEATAGE